MGSKINIPVADQDVDPTDPVGSLKTIGIMIVGFTILMIAFAFGQDFAGNIQNLLTDVLGIESGEGERIEVV